MMKSFDEDVVPLNSVKTILIISPMINVFNFTRSTKDLQMV